ncbi:hypothetical protein A2631_03480 [Candidatus Daviesbacteria bacterium RIFCSPHIGHO2_01_FULL_44_29]|uniref:Uncharacterized protein n=1 Tax=Candidatus Daviesbacteria bacterium RIFCSPHIGHO2_02_FULL_43_12 TaxID=1797776 RepID=A0A1F5KFM4_9BACT|nr:MAG: hypothetical protein A2631_03480 [Candidatus Daviesbacteria bacterium RIFCSPHIGHO2_01_FULL_44_29]OGE38840.1 MAG: hypothetical protein A3E86_02905 [Candidatus Daviesbacteria bacterium RIFCSPHIGHO2_12_FULL_47_45]OGE39737.1 MAG: hypothetical protein A3D25_03345 [Candidatus Daviesbacteria bacterium RIFCSPHIGHO2_02_FULL_43_12]OGE69972.1 MAG: hypothetical protein A3B55_04745 [Candidatus Daviesbacteria bacterium RIFCSPLOWO2_01_FULL_43_15]
MTKTPKVLNIIYQAVEDSFVNQTLSEKKVHQFFKIFAELRSADAIYCLRIYLQGLKKYIQKRTLVIESPVSLSLVDQNNIRDNLSKSYSITKSLVKLDSSLLGGLRIKIGDVILDDSVKSRISQLGEAIRN